MYMSTKLNIIGLFIAAAALSTSVAYAETGNAGNFTAAKTIQEGSDIPRQESQKRWGDGRKNAFKGKVLNLNEDQNKQLDAIREKQTEIMKSSFEKMKNNRQALNDELVKASPDINKVNQLQSELKGINGEMVDNQLNATLEAKKVMSPEQFAGYMALNRAEKMRGAHEGKGWGGHGKRHHGDKKHETCTTCAHHKK
jgi:Spy/CpxP family protein refolding chaperone